MAKLLQCVGECSSFWNKPRFHRSAKTLASKGKKLDRKTFVKRTGKLGRDYAESSAMAREGEFVAKEARYVEGNVKGVPSLLMIWRKYIWIFQ